MSVCHPAGKPGALARGLACRVHRSLRPTGRGMLQPHEMSPDQLRARHEALLDDARKRAKRFVPPRQPAPIPGGSVLLEETVPGGWYWSLRLRRGTALRLANPPGTHGVSPLFWNADNPSERHNAADTVRVQWTTHLTTGSLLLSDMGRARCSR